MDNSGEEVANSEELERHVLERVNPRMSAAVTR